MGEKFRQRAGAFIGIFLQKVNAGLLILNDALDKFRHNHRISLQKVSRGNRDNKVAAITLIAMIDRKLRIEKERSRLKCLGIVDPVIRFLESSLYPPALKRLQLETVQSENNAVKS